MKTKFSGILTLLLAFVVHISFAQEKTISGAISDEQGLPLPGVNIIVKGTSNGTQSDFDGNYSINASVGDVLLFTYVGQKDEQRTVGSASTINVAMQEDASVLDEVVVTALGIKREKQALGYATQQLDSETLEKTGAGSTNIVDALNGSVSGVEVLSSSGDVGSPSSIVIRGVSSLTGSNQALFVIDGVPIDNSSVAAGSTDFITGVNRAGDIDFSNVESISVLKGGAATVLYGERGANGVVLITTKKGVDSGKLNINLSSSYTVSTPNRFPDFQYQYARGRNGLYSNVTHWSWGPDYASNPTFPAGTNTDLDADGISEDVSGVEIPFYRNNYKNWFNTGTTLTNNLTFSGANDKGSFFTSYTRVDQEGIVPNSSLLRNSFNINGTYHVNDKFTFGANVNFVRSETNKAASGINGWGDGLGYWHHMWDINRPWKDANGQATWFSGAVPDPNWIVNEDNELSEVNRLFGNVNFNYAFTNWFNLGVKIGIDTYTDSRERYRPISAVQSAGNGLGDGYINKINLTDTNSLITLSGQGNITNDVGFSYMIGNNIFESRYNSVITTGTTQILPDFYNLENFVDVTTNTFINKYRTIGVLGDLTFDYKKLLYLGITARNDWSSTLPSDNNSYFYPSANLGFIYSKLIDDSSILNYGKLRGSIAQTGKSADPYQIENVYVKDGDNVLNLPRFTTSDLARNPNLKPEISTEWEIGTELKLLESKIGLDFTYYNKLSEDQILQVPTGVATGFSSQVINAGDVRNKGFEVLLSVNDLFKVADDFSWGVNLNFTTNENTVESLADGFTDQVIVQTGWWSTTKRVARVGESAGTIVGIGYQRDDSGNILVADNGLPLLTSEDIVLGDIFPDWKLGITTNLKYKNWGLSFLFDIKKGGDVINDSEGWWVYSGLSKSTENRYYPGNPNANAVTVINGVNANTGLQNNVATPLTNGYYHDYFSFNDERLVEDASWVRLRNVSLSYNFPNSLIDRIGLNNLSLSLTGNNLWLDTNYSGKDPETSGWGSGNSTGWDINGAPSTKSYTFNLKIGF